MLKYRQLFSITYRNKFRWCWRVSVVSTASVAAKGSLVLHAKGHVFAFRHKVGLMRCWPKKTSRFYSHSGWWFTSLRPKWSSLVLPVSLIALSHDLRLGSTKNLLDKLLILKTVEEQRLTKLMSLDLFIFLLYHPHISALASLLSSQPQLPWFQNTWLNCLKRRLLINSVFTASLLTPTCMHDAYSATNGD